MTDLIREAAERAAHALVGVDFAVKRADLIEAALRETFTGAGLETVKDGFAALPTGPGLGITVDEEALKKYRGATA